MRISPAIFFTLILMCITVASIFGRVHFALDSLSHFKVLYAALFALSAAFFLFAREAKWLALSVVGLTVNLAYVIPWYVADREWVAHDSDDSIMVLISNVHLRSREYDRLLNLIDQEKPDILGLIEVDSNWLSALASLRSTYQFNFEFPKDNGHGLALFSKLPILHPRISWFGDSATPAISANVMVGSEVFELIVAHPTAPLNADRAKSRNSQLRHMAEHVRASDKAVVLAADLNTTMWSPYYGEFVEDSGLINARAGYGIGATWASRSPFGVPIDHIMVTSPSRIGDFRVHESIGSDHRPISAQIQINPRYSAELGDLPDAH